ncbi:MAG: DUF3341 domain-containing protein [Calditrichaceae bacterium]|nr:DUF3341 domain-containing protein [Calditrichia bacterium]NUQ42484.1 DUF3341 domain-containing protein [Calditrichaceae bacterium]
MEYRFNNKKDFMEKLEALFKDGMRLKKMKIYMPHPEHDVEHLVEKYEKPSRLKFFTLVGGLTGCLTGFAFTTYTVFSWPLVTGGKPFISIPPFTVIAFELTILLGALFSFAGIMILARLPKISKMFAEEVHGNEYIIITDDAR